MGLRTMTCTDGSLDRAILYCSTTMRALPFLFRNEQDADDFVAIHGDVRKLTAVDLSLLFDAWEREQPPDSETRHPHAVRELGMDGDCPDPDCPFPAGECKNPEKNGADR
jgi:hypothetical protein